MAQHSVKRKSHSVVGRVAFIAVLVALLMTACYMAIRHCLPAESASVYGESAQNAHSGSVGMTTSGASEAPFASEQMKATEAVVSRMIAPYEENVAVAVMPLDGAAGFSINGERAFTAASMIKLLILAEYMQEVDAGLLDAEGIYVLQASDIVGGSGIVQESSLGTPYTYADLVRHMVVHSDNTATNILIDTMGRDSINSRAVDIGLSGTELRRRMMRVNEGEENYISANDAATLLCGIAQHTLASGEMCEVAESYLLDQVDSEGLAQGLPADIRFGHKTGSLASVRHDGGIVYGENPYVVVMLTSLDETTANELMKEISSAVYEELDRDACPIPHSE